MKTEELMKREGHRRPRQEEGLTPEEKALLERAAKFFENKIIDGIDGVLVAFVIREELIEGNRL